MDPVSVEEILPLIFVCDPATAPVTVTLIVHVPLAASEPPVSEMVRGAVVVNVPPEQADVDAEATVKPSGNVSEKAMPLNALVALGLLRVNVSVLALP